MLPAILILLLGAMSFGIALAKHGQPSGEYNVGTTLVSLILLYALLYWGGFFDVLLPGR